MDLWNVSYVAAGHKNSELHIKSCIAVIKHTFNREILQYKFFQFRIYLQKSIDFLFSTIVSLVYRLINTFVRGIKDSWDAWSIMSEFYAGFYHLLRNNLGSNIRMNLKLYRIVSVGTGTQSIGEIWFLICYSIHVHFVNHFFNIFYHEWKRLNVYLYAGVDQFREY